MDELFNISRAKMADAIKIYDLMTSVYEKLDNKSLFFCDDLEYVKNHVEKYGFIVKVVDNEKAESDEKIVASLIVRFPKDLEDNLGRDVGIAELLKVAHIESVVVAMDYRGYGLQDKMIKFAEEIIVQRGYTYLMATVSPDNKHSLANFEKNGYEVVKIKEKYGGMIRAILLKKI